MNQHPVARTLVLVTAGLSLLQMMQSPPLLLMPSVLLLLAVVVVVVLVRGGEHRWRDPFALAVGLTFFCGLVTALGFATDHGATGPASAAIALVYLGCVGAAVLGRARWARWGFWALLAVHALLVLADFATLEPVIDVQVFLEHGIDAMFSGSSPYGVTMPNVFDAEETELFYGEGVVRGDEVLYGFPYLPASLLLDTLAHLVGEVRLMHLAALLATAVLLRHLATDRVGRTLAVMLVVAPVSRINLIAYWIEPLLGLLVGLAVWSMLRERSRAAGVSIGLLLASKQYLVVVLPALWSVWRSSGRRPVVVGVAVAAVVISAFFAWDPVGFWRSVVEWQFVQPFRDDALSLLPGLQALLGPLPGWLVSGPSLLLGFAVSAAVAWRTRPGPTAFALGVGLSLLVTVLLSKQAFPNYFLFIGTALLFAVVTWPVDDPRGQTRAPLSQGSRGSRDMVATR